MQFFQTSLLPELEITPYVPSDLPRIDSKKSREVGGTGLGLYIVKEIVEKLDGKLSFTSSPGIGSVFYVTLPSRNIS